MTATRPPAITPSEAEDDPQNECLVCSEGIAITEIFCPACKRRYPTPLLACAEQYDGRVLRYPGEYRVKLITGESFTVHGAKITGDFAELWKWGFAPEVPGELNIITIRTDAIVWVTEICEGELYDN
jgi:hypothetical protein